MSGRGGRRPGAGRPAKPKIEAPRLTKSLAIELYQDASTRKRWEKLRNAKDQRLRFDVEREISHQAIGRPVQALVHKSPEPLKVNVTIRRIGS